MGLIEQGFTWVVLFFDKYYRVLLQKEAVDNNEIVFSQEEIDFLKNFEVTKYAISPNNRVVEEQVEKLFNIKKLR